MRERKSGAARIAGLLLFCAIAALAFQAARYTGALDWALRHLRGTPSGAAQATQAPIPDMTPDELNEEIKQAIAEYSGEEDIAEDDLTRLSRNLDKIPPEYVSLLLRNPETLPFVTGYLDYRPTSRVIIDVSGEVKNAAFLPYFKQWDKRWGYLEYGDSGASIAIAGCGPTALAMVAAGLTGDAEINPKAVADYAYKSGYYAGEAGTGWALMSEGCRNYNLTAQEVPLDENVLKNTLKSGVPIIASMGAGTFTQSGHFIVMTGVDENGDFLILDPNSPKKSAMSWPYSVFRSEARNFWSFTAGGDS